MQVWDEGGSTGRLASDGEIDEEVNLFRGIGFVI